MQQANNKTKRIYPLLQAVGSKQVPKSHCVHMPQPWTACKANCDSRKQSHETSRQWHFKKGEWGKKGGGGVQGLTVGACYGLKCKRHLSAEAPGAAGTADWWASVVENPGFQDTTEHQHPPACTPLCGHQFHPPPLTKQHVRLPAIPTP